MSRKRIMIMNNEKDYIDNIMVNDQLAIVSCNFKTSKVTRGKTAQLTVMPENSEIASSVIVIDLLTNEPIKISPPPSYNTLGGLVCKWKAELPIGKRYFDVYLLDKDGKRSPNGVTVSIEYT